MQFQHMVQLQSLLDCQCQHLVIIALEFIMTTIVALQTVFMLFWLLAMGQRMAGYAVQ